MEEKEQKKATSVLYHVSNYRIEYDIIHDFGRMCGLFNKGPEAIKDYLTDTWNEIRGELLKRDDLEVLDIERVISRNDFNVTFNISKDKEPVFFITFPDYNNNIAESKCIAFAITKSKPRFFAMEHLTAYDGTSNEYIFGEFVFDYIKHKFDHYNYGNLEKDTITHFATRVIEEVER